MQYIKLAHWPGRLRRKKKQNHKQTPVANLILWSPWQQRLRAVSRTERRVVPARFDSFPALFYIKPSKYLTLTKSKLDLKGHLWLKTTRLFWQYSHILSTAPRVNLCTCEWETVCVLMLLRCLLQSKQFWAEFFST